jgi:hypothetical protein
LTQKTIEISRFQSFLGWFTDWNMDLLVSLGSLETVFLRKNLEAIKIDRPIFVCGLARSGTTILLELLAENSQLGTYRYKDFPLVMLPYWWDRYLKNHGKGNEVAVERSHKDGIFVTPESPEAMEEILWIAFFPQSHIPTTCNVMDAGGGSVEFETYYKNTIRKLLLTRDASIYLAKNNYNIARLTYLKKLFQDCRFIIPFRNPVWHIASLMKQQRLLNMSEASDKRVLNYMRRSGHFEFGQDRRPINFGNDYTTREIIRLWKKGKEIEGWTKYWHNTYTFLAKQLTSHKSLGDCSVVVDYDNLCNFPQKELIRIYRFLNLNVNYELVEKQGKRLNPPTYYALPFSEKEIDFINYETLDAYAAMRKLTENRA